MIKIATFTVPGQPLPKERPRATRTGRMYTTEATRKAEQRVASSFLENLGVRHTIETPVTGNLKLRCWFYRKNNVTADTTNMLKVVEDGLNGLAWVDDRQLVDVHGTRAVDRDNPRTEVEIWTIGTGQ